MAPDWQPLVGEAAAAQPGPLPTAHSVGRYGSRIVGPAPKRQPECLCF